MRKIEKAGRWKAQEQSPHSAGQRANAKMLVVRYFCLYLDSDAVAAFCAVSDRVTPRRNLAAIFVNYDSAVGAARPQ